MTIAPDTRYRQLFAAAQKEAKRAGRGIWGKCNKEKEKQRATL
jgi:endonuclease YncB( thermonuclease family)